MATNDPNKPDNVTYIDPGNKTPETGDETTAPEMTAEEAAALAGEGEKALHDLGEEQLEPPAPFDMGGEHMYTGMLDPGMTLEGIYQRFNIDRPEDFAGHSLSVSDVVVLRSGGQWTAHYVDSFGFADVPEFLDWPHKYYSTQRPVDIGTFPKTESGPVQIVNFDKREWIEDATFKAWGYLVYNAPLTGQQISDYELRAASDNPDHTRLSPYQVAAQTQIVGKWEQSKRTPDIKRLTWWYPDFGVFAKKEFVTPERIAERFGQIIESKDRTAEMRAAKKPISDQLKEGAEQAARDNAVRPASVPDKDKGDRE